MKLAYLIYNERPASGLLNSQVLGLLSELAKDDQLDITLIAIWQPWIYFRHRKTILDLSAELKHLGVRFLSLPLALPSRYCFKNLRLLRANVIFVLYFLKVVNLNRYDVVHGRGYFISYVAALSKKKYRLIFDMRSLFPEENVSAGNWNRGDPIYRQWKEIERFTIRMSDYSVVVSKPMIESINWGDVCDKFRYVPIGFDKKKFQIDIQSREQVRHDLGLQDKKVIVYSGSLQLNFWNDIRIYAEYFNMISSEVENVHFLILTNSDKELIAKHFIEHNIYNYTAISAESAQIPTLLSAADVGIQVMYPMTDSATRFGVKTVEYWAAGLPVITNSNVGGICGLVEEQPYLGVIVNSCEDVGRIHSCLKENKAHLIKAYAIDNFDFMSISSNYRKLYEGVST